MSKKEAVEALKGINNLKALWCDGFNALFFTKAWDIIEEDVIEAVQEFFQTQVMYKAINCTAITLFPKVPNPDMITQSRPISCCTLLYKIILKVLTSRLQVMDCLVDMNRSAFVLGRQISDNIILSHELVKGYRRKCISLRCMLKVDMRKGYDSIEWIYLEQVIECL